MARQSRPARKRRKAKEPIKVKVNVHLTGTKESVKDPIEKFKERLEEIRRDTSLSLPTIAPSEKKREREESLLEWAKDARKKLVPKRKRK